MMNERGLAVDHTTIFRWVQAYAPELEKRIRPHLRPTNYSYSVDETYVKIKGEWEYLYRAVDSTGLSTSLTKLFDVLSNGIWHVLARGAGDSIKPGVELKAEPQVRVGEPSSP